MDNSIIRRFGIRGFMENVCVLMYTEEGEEKIYTVLAIPKSVDPKANTATFLYWPNERRGTETLTCAGGQVKMLARVKPEYILQRLTAEFPDFEEIIDPDIVVRNGD